MVGSVCKLQGVEEMINSTQQFFLNQFFKGLHKLEPQVCNHSKSLGGCFFEWEYYRLFP